MNGFGWAIASAILCLGLAGCGQGTSSPEAAGSAEIEDLVKKQIELHILMANILDNVGDHRSYQLASPRLQEMKEASENLHDALANLPSDQTAPVVERYAKEFQA